MREPLTLAQVKAVLAAAPKGIDPGVREMLTDEAVNYLESATDIARAVRELEAQIEARDKNFADLNLALVDYANETGAGQMMMDNLKLCIDQVRKRKQANG